MLIYRPADENVLISYVQGALCTRLNQCVVTHIRAHLINDWLH